MRPRFFVCFLAMGLVAGCSLIRSFDDFERAGRDAGAFGEDGIAADASSEAANGPDGALSSEKDAGLACSSDRVACASLHACVDPLDPDFGCAGGDAGACVACDGTGASSVKCVGSAAGPVCRPTCLPDRADCDKDPANGCETDLTKATSCGACDAGCPDSGPLCALLTGGHACVGGCPSGQMACGNECVFVMTNPEHCGSCTKSCSVPTNGRATCNGGNCGFECLPGSHACGNDCALNSDPARCGTGCVNCYDGAPPHTTPSCQSGMCSYVCATGWDDCNGSANDGCETQGGCQPPDNGAPGN